MGIDVPTILDALLEATADEATAKARIASLRASLEEEARRRFTTERAAPSWNAPELGKVRFDPPGKWEAMVVDDKAWGSWVAERHPSEATGVIRLPARLLGEAIQALEFAVMGDGDTMDATVEVRPAWSSTFLGQLTVDVEETTDPETLAVDREFTITDADGQLVDGVTGTRSAAKLVVSLDRDRRTQAIESARSAAGALIEVAQTDEGPEVDREELDERRRYLEGLHADVLAAYAARLELSKSGTKAELAERIARTEAITGRRELVPASGLAQAASGGPDPEPETVYLQDPIPPHRYDPEGRDDTPTGRSCKACGGHRDEEGTNHIGHDHTCPVDCGPEHDRAMEEDADRQLAELEAEDAAEPERGSVAYLDGKRAAAIEETGSREDLRRYAKAKGVGASGTKAQVAKRIADAGHTADDVTNYLEEPTP